MQCDVVSSHLENKAGDHLSLNQSSLCDRKGSKKVSLCCNQETVFQNCYILNGSVKNFTPGALGNSPKDISLYILSYLSFFALAGVCRVNKEWEKLANDPSFLKRLVYRDVAFGQKQWTCWDSYVPTHGKLKQCEYDAEDFASLPLNIGMILKSPCHAFPGKRKIQTHVLTRVSKDFTLKILGILAKKFFPNNSEGYSYIEQSILKRFGDITMDKSTWILMTRDALPGSRNISFAKQKAIVIKLAKNSKIPYQIPSPVEATACILAEYFKSILLGKDSESSTRLFSNNPWTFIRCQWTITKYGCRWSIQDEQINVGGFAQAGLAINRNHKNHDSNDYAIAAVWRLSSDQTASKTSLYRLIANKVKNFVAACFRHRFSSKLA